MIRIAVIAGLCVCAVGQADPPLAKLQEQSKSAIASVRNSVVTVVVSQAESADQKTIEQTNGQLGEYVSSTDKSSRDPLDLRLIVNAGKHLNANGVVVGERLILTPYHVIDGATKIFVRSNGGIEGSYANVYAADARSDLAILELITPVKGLTPVRLAAAKRLQVGDVSIAVSVSFGEGSQADVGTISATNRKIEVPAEFNFGGIQQAQPFVAYSTLAQTTAPNAKRLSGSGVFNLDGELIGLTTALAAIAGSDQSAGYLMPMDDLYRPIVEVLKTGREVEYGFLGISWQPRFGGGMRFGGAGMGRGRFAPPIVADDPNGIPIGGVSPGMPGEKAGLREGDQLAAVNGMPITSQSELQFRIAVALADRPTEITYRRNGRLMPPVTVNLVKSKNAMPFIASRKPAPVFGITVDHWSTLMQDVMQNEREARSLIVPQGVVIAKIETGSPAAQVFTEINRKYVITAVNGQPTLHPNDFERMTKNAKSIQLTVARVGDPSGRTVEVTLP